MRQILMFLALLILIGTGITINAAPIVYNMVLDTSPLAAVPGPYALGFELLNVGALGDSLLTIDMFTGVPLFGVTTTGGATGNLITTANFVDIAVSNTLRQGFNPTGVMKFNINIFNAGPGDSFSMFLENDGFRVPTTSDDDSFFVIVLTVPLPPHSLSATDSDNWPNGAAGPIFMGPPTIAEATGGGAIPEPATFVLLGAGLFGIGVLRRKEVQHCRR